MREIDVGELVATSPVPFVRHQLDPDATDRAWVLGDAVVADGTVSRWVDAPPGPVRTCLGPRADLAPLMAALVSTVAHPWRVTVESDCRDLLPPPWRQDDPRTWRWMTTRDRPRLDAGSPAALSARVVEVDDDEVERVLDAAHPDSFARPGTHRVEVWLGVRDAGRVAGVGALVRQADGTGHLRGVSVLPEHRGRGLGRLLSSRLTDRALDGDPALASLGVFEDNAPALRIYAGLGYRTVHTLQSGVCRWFVQAQGDSSSTAADPSR